MHVKDSSLNQDIFKVCQLLLFCSSIAICLCSAIFEECTGMWISLLHLPHIILYWCQFGIHTELSEIVSYQSWRLWVLSNTNVHAINLISMHRVHSGVMQLLCSVKKTIFWLIAMRGPPYRAWGHLYTGEPVVEITLGLDRSRDSWECVQGEDEMKRVEWKNKIDR